MGWGDLPASSTAPTTSLSPERRGTAAARKKDAASFRTGGTHRHVPDVLREPATVLLAQLL